jgi:hypothetical protein
MIEAIPDDFGPTLYRRTDRLAPLWEEQKKVANSPAYKFGLDPNRMVWLTSALDAVNKACAEAKLVDADFKNPEAEWEPIPIDRASPKFERVVETIDKTIEAVEQDNGYNGTMPEEKAFVVDSLKAVAGKLKNQDVISYAYLKRTAIDTLDILIRRFGGASVGLIAQATRAAIFDWLKDIGAAILHMLH